LRTVLEQRRGREAHSADYIAIIFGGGEDDDAGGQLIEIDFFEDGESVFIRQCRKSSRRISGLSLASSLIQFSTILRFADDDHFFIAIEEFAQAVAEDRMIVRHENPNLLFCFRHI